MQSRNLDWNDLGTNHSSVLVLWALVMWTSVWSESAFAEEASSDREVSDEEVILSEWKVRGGTYRDTNGDGIVDWLMIGEDGVLDGAAQYWIDSDFDGFFDIARFMADFSGASEERQIKRPVPPIHKTHAPTRRWKSKKEAQRKRWSSKELKLNSMLLEE